MEKNQLEDLKNLIYEVNCLGCGKIAFNIPFIINTYHTLTCKSCGEVNIFHILENGSIAFATAAQREEALVKALNLSESQMNTFGNRLNGGSFSRCISYKVEGLIIKFQTHSPYFLEQKEVEKFNGLLPIEKYKKNSED